ncbi:MAG: threonine ammonia-lyase [Limisphaerales bacterium]
MGHRIQLERIRLAATRIQPVFLNSPVLCSDELNEALGVELILKDETQNPIKCFKGRGSDFLAAEHSDGRPIVCASAGNFGQAMAYSGVRRGLTVTVYASENASPLKLDRMRELGAHVVLHGEDFDAAKVEARRVANDSKVRFVEDSKDIETVEGAGTLGMEMLEYAGPYDALLIALGNGAMFNGIAAVFKELSPKVEMIAVQAQGAPAMLDSWRAGKIITHDSIATIADGIGVREPVPEAVEDMNPLIDDGILVSEESIIEGMRLLKNKAGVVAEPSSAVGLAAILENRDRFAGRRVGAVLCGGNVSMEQFREWL